MEVSISLKFAGIYFRKKKAVWEILVNKNLQISLKFGKHTRRENQFP